MSTPAAEARPQEVMACAIARAIRDGDRVGVGVNSPVPAAAVVLARLTHAPTVRYRLPGVAGAEDFVGSKEFFDAAQRGEIDLFFLSGVQIDAGARINLTEAGGRRFSGAFGSAVLYPIVPRVILFRMEHSPRVFVPRVEFVTAAGTPEMVVTPLAVLGFDRVAGRLRLRSYHPGQSIASVRAATGFDLEVEAGANETVAPTPAELHLLRGPVAGLLAGAYPRFAEALRAS